MMDRRTFLCGLTHGTPTVALVVQAQSEGRVYRIGYLADFSPTTYPARNEGFRQGLRDH
jgi:hypothetical protein